MMDLFKVPFSAGGNRPKLRVPEGACDTHLHIYHPDRFPYVTGDSSSQPSATAEDYRLLQKRLGLTRNVIVTPSIYGTYNRCTLDALREFGDSARGVVVIEETIPDEELEQLHRAGVRGVRINMECGGMDDPEKISLLASKIAPFGWHMCFWMNADRILEWKDVFDRLPCQLVFDHRGHLPAKKGTGHGAFSVITHWMEKGKAWVKLSALYHDSCVEGYRDTMEVGRAYVRAVPERVLWGTDWPHPSELHAPTGMPNDADMLDGLLFQAETEENVKRILVDNPQKLYGF